MKTLFNILFSVVLGAFCSAQTALGYILKKDDVFVVKQDAKQVIVQTIDGAAHEITNNLNGILEFRVTDTNETNYHIAMRFKDLNLKMTSSIQGELMNVRAKEVIEDDLQSKIFNSLLDVPVALTLAKNGDIVTISGGDSLITKMVQASGIADDFQMNMMKKGLEKEFGSQALSDSYEQMTYIYPQNEVAIGDSWENEYTGKLNAKNKWTLEAISEENTTISGTAKVVMHVVDEANNMKLNGTQRTRITADRTSGFLQLMTVEGEARGTATMAQLGDTEIPTSISSTITYKLINQYHVQ
ncbi:hypothetical protein FGM00_09615 [Aggregatimonas sangjinii]|uniref:Uncharacterized protein n=1 Tax=Aggregatimonas sangjinii TaxID=2583587 RepID=A0A5B7SP39_9FLAO|nr:DUF6263 family protein [Aggregatimonas sangjinii]QCX00356.1 hypothetical protein FGM00_09615 [Aggregatimonas sangjinii]